MFTIFASASSSAAALAQDILRDQNVHWARTPGCGHPECVAHHVGNAFPVFHLSTPLDGGPEQGQVVNHLRTSQVRVGIANVAAARGGDGDDRAALALGADEARDEVCGTRACTGHHHRRFARDARVAVGKVRGRRLVAWHDEVHVQLVPQAFEGFQHHHVRPVGDRVDKSHALGVQAPYQQFSASDFRHFSLLEVIGIG
jgi:hypothetical protein